MDDAKCPRNYFLHLLAENKGDSLLGKYTSNRKEFPLYEKTCQGDIAYIQNPLFDKIALKSFNENTESCKTALTNGRQKSKPRNNRYDKLLFPKLNFQNSQPRENDGAPINTKPKSRRERMKERAETRRDKLIDESSDDDYSSKNSFSNSRTTTNKYSTIMDDAYNRRSRSARTERYLRRFSKEDGFHDNEGGRIQGSDLPWGERETRAFYHSDAKNLRERNPGSHFFNQNDIVLNNPIYNLSSGGSPTFQYQSKSPVSGKDFFVHKVYEGNFDYGKTRRSDPGSDTILAYKNIKSPRAFDRVHYVEPKAFNYQPQQTKPSVESTQRVKRSHSFQSEIPKDFEFRKNISLTMDRAAKLDKGKLGSKNLEKNRKWIDSITSPVPITPGYGSSHVAADFPQRKSYLAKDKSEPVVNEMGLRKRSEQSSTGIDRDSTNLLLSTINREKIPIKKRSSKDLGKELSELEKMYNSLRLSDDNLLERAEERCVEEFSQKGQSSNELTAHLSSSSSSESIHLKDALPVEDLQESSEANHVINDDMAYRKMQSKKMPALSETQNSLSQISYLLASSAMILDKTDYPDDLGKEAKEKPSITKDDMVYRNFNYVNNVLKVADPQPPFGIPLRPATPATNSNYLCSSPVTVKSAPLKFVPQSEPNLITDDLAFRNLRKDTPKTPLSALPGDNKNESNVFVFKTDPENPVSEDQFIKKKKKAVRSLSANLYGLINEVHSLGLNIT